MASGNQGQGQGRRNEGRSQNGGMRDQGGQGGMKEQAQNLGQGLQEGAEQVANRLREGYGAVTEQAAHHYRRAEGTIARNPAPSVLIGFGLGLGLGLALTAIMTRDDEESSWSGWSRSLPHSMSDVSNSLHRMKKQGMKAAQDSHAADTLHETFHHLAEQIRDLPSVVARMMPGR